MLKRNTALKNIVNNERKKMDVSVLISNRQKYETTKYDYNKKSTQIDDSEENKSCRRKLVACRKPKKSESQYSFGSVM